MLFKNKKKKNKNEKKKKKFCLLSSIKISYISWYLTCKIPKISKFAIFIVPKAFKNSINIAKIIYYGGDYDCHQVLTNVQQENTLKMHLYIRK